MLIDDFAGMFNNIEILDLDDILEFLEDNDLLNVKGKAFKQEFWEKYSSYLYKEQELTEEEISELEKAIDEMLDREKKLKIIYKIINGILEIIDPKDPERKYMYYALKFSQKLLEKVLKDEEILSD